MITKGKWVGVTLTPNQKQAQRIIRRRNEKRSALITGLRSMNYHIGRDEAHKSLDALFDKMEGEKKRALDLFPEVEDSLVIATDVLYF